MSSGYGLSGGTYKFPVGLRDTMGHLEETEWVGSSRAGSNWTGNITGTSATDVRRREKKEDREYENRRARAKETARLGQLDQTGRQLKHHTWRRRAGLNWKQLRTAIQAHRNIH